MPASVTDLQYVALAVPDLDAQREFFGKTWGLVEAGEEDGRVLLAAEGSPHPYVISLRQDDERKTDLVGFSAASRADVDALFRQVQAAGAKIISSPGETTSAAGDYAFRFFDPFLENGEEQRIHGARGIPATAPSQRQCELSADREARS